VSQNKIVDGIELLVVGIIELRRDLGKARPFLDKALRIAELHNQRLEIRARRDEIKCLDTGRVACWMRSDAWEWCENCVERDGRHREMLAMSARIGGARSSLTRLAKRALAELLTCEECGALATHAVRDMFLDGEYAAGAERWSAGEPRHGCDQHPQKSRRIEP
jgi:hypothetical protein